MAGEVLSKSEIMNSPLAKSAAPADNAEVGYVNLRGNPMPRRCPIEISIVILAMIGCWSFLFFGRAVEAGTKKPPIQFLLQWGKLGKEAGEFHSPIGIAISAKDEIFITEFKNNRVQKFSTEGKFLAQFSVENMPGGIAVDSQGRIYVAPMMSHRICVYDETGKLVRAWGKGGKRDGEFDQPGGITIAKDGTVYVADQVNRRVQRFSPEGKFLGKWGEYGTKPGQFDGVENLKSRTGGPHFLALDRNGNIYSTEAKLGRIQKFTAEGKALLAFGRNGVEPGGFGGRPKNLPGPIGIAVDRWDRIWVSATNNRVQCFSPGGKYLFGFESLEPGTRPGQFHTPHALALDSQDHLYVVDAQNHRVQKFAIPASDRK
jgi:DNA-binding beta-propeller fold protein YncE